jgi:hypothetical protein
VHDQPIHDRRRQPRYLGQQAEAAGADRGVERIGRGRIPDCLGHRDQVDHLGGGEQVELDQRLVERTGLATGRQVVTDDERAVGVNAGHQLVELQREQAAVRAELDHVTGDLIGDAADHLQALYNRDRVADRDQVLDLQRGQRTGDLVQAQLVPLQRGQGLVGPGQDRGGVVEDVALAVDVEPDDAHRLAD